jgi:hypothetical protein
VIEGTEADSPKEPESPVFGSSYIQTQQQNRKRKTSPRNNKMVLRSNKKMKTPISEDGLRSESLRMDLEGVAECKRRTRAAKPAMLRLSKASTKVGETTGGRSRQECGG